jgi:hypothetical protein
MRGVVVEDQLDGGVCRISGVKFLKKTDKLPVRLGRIKAFTLKVSSG